MPKSWRYENILGVQLQDASASYYKNQLLATPVAGNGIEDSRSYGEAAPSGRGDADLVLSVEEL